MGSARQGGNRGDDREDGGGICNCNVYPWGSKVNSTRMSVYEFSVFSRFFDQLVDPEMRSEKHMVVLLHYLVDLLVKDKSEEEIYLAELEYKRQTLSDLLEEVNNELSQRKYLDSLFKEFIRLEDGQFPTKRLVRELRDALPLFFRSRARRRTEEMTETSYLSLFHQAYFTRRQSRIEQNIHDCHRLSMLRRGYKRAGISEYGESQLTLEFNGQDDCGPLCQRRNRARHDDTGEKHPKPGAPTTFKKIKKRGAPSSLSDVLELLDVEETQFSRDLHRDVGLVQRLQQRLQPLGNRRKRRKVECGTEICRAFDLVWWTFLTFADIYFLGAETFVTPFLFFTCSYFYVFCPWTCILDLRL